MYNFAALRSKHTVLQVYMWYRMEPKTNRLYFIDAMRAWAILMMLQGHFVDGLLDPVFRDDSNMVYTIWTYFRGITAPVFFTVSGFIFTYLLIRVPGQGLDNPRVKKGIKRGFQLLFIGYLLRLNLFGLLKGQIYESTYLVDVLHCIGLSLLGIIGVYLFTERYRSRLFPGLLLGIALLLFAFEPMYKQWSFSFLPDLVANYFTKANGSVFTIIPWFGYTAIGAFLSTLFTRYRDHRMLYPVAIILSLFAGLGLILFSSMGFEALAQYTGVELFQAINNNNYLFIRLGNVLVVFAVFMLLRGILKNRTLIQLGQNTLSIYVIHFIFLYGSFTGLGIYPFLHHSLPPYVVIPGALTFMGICSYASLQYNVHELRIKEWGSEAIQRGWILGDFILENTQRVLKNTSVRLLRLLGLVKS